MEVRQEFALTPASAEALDPAVERSNVGWPEVCEMLAGEGCCIWNIDDRAFVLTLVNADNEIEALLAGGEGFTKYARMFEEAVAAHPSHAGMTMRIDGRKGWRRHFAHWDERDGVLYRRIG